MRVCGVVSFNIFAPLFCVLFFYLLGGFLTGVGVFYYTKHPSLSFLQRLTFDFSLE